jgi:hypothetical protein
VTAVDELKEKFGSLTDEDKLTFMKSIMPSFCETFRKNPASMMLFCQDMMKSCGMDVQGMMKVMMGMMNAGKS